MVLLYVSVVATTVENMKARGDFEISCEVDPVAADASQCRPGAGKTRLGRSLREGDSF